MLNLYIKTKKSTSLLSLSFHLFCRSKITSKSKVNTMTNQEILLDYLSAFNNRDIAKTLSFLDENCRVLFNGQVVLQGVESLRPLYEKDFANPELTVTLVESNVDNSNPNDVRVLLKLGANRFVDVTYVFENGKMIEHRIHSDTTH